MTDADDSLLEPNTPYRDNAALLGDLQEFGVSLIGQARGDATAMPTDAHNDSAMIWRRIAARMADSVKAEIFIPLAHVALVFQLDAHDLQLLTLSLLLQTDHSMAEPWLALMHELEQDGRNDDVGRFDPIADAHVPVRIAAHLLGDIRACLFTDSPLCQHNLIDLVDVNVSTLSGAYRVVPSVAAYLLGLAAPQPRIGEHACVDLLADEALGEVIVDASVTQQMQRFVDICAAPGARFGPIVLHIESDDTELGEAMAAAAFAQLGYGVTRLDAKHLRWTYQGDNQRLGPLLRELRLACRDAALCTQILMLTDSAVLIGDEERDRVDLFDATLQSLLEATTYLVVLNGSARRVADAVSEAHRQGARLFRIQVGELTPELRRQAWTKHASYRDLSIGDPLLTELARTYAFTERRIAAVTDTVAGHHALSPSDSIESSVWKACRAEAEDHPIRVARRVETPYRLHDLVAPGRTVALIRETLGQMRYRPKVMDAWGFAAKYPSVTNLCALFHGPSGTGKTMAASIIANELSLPLYRVDISAVLSKYIGETEQNIERLFVWAEKVKVVLLFDEADGFFSKRTETKDSNDRFANMQIGFLLQRIESYPGLVVLSTNLMSNMDKAFLRRIHFTVEFPFPTAEERLRLWRQIFPEPVPLDGDVDVELLAKKASLSGGHIRNAAVSAAFLAAGDGTAVKMAHLVKAVGREYEKLGKLFSEAGF